MLRRKRRMMLLKKLQRKMGKRKLINPQLRLKKSLKRKPRRLWKSLNRKLTSLKTTRLKVMRILTRPRMIRNRTILKKVRKIKNLKRLRMTRITRKLARMARMLRRLLKNRLMQW